MMISDVPSSRRSHEYPDIPSFVQIRNIKEQKMDNKKKLRPIRRTMLVTILSAVTLSLILTSLFGVISMINIQNKAEKALTDQAMSNLSDLIDKKTEMADQRFRRYKETAVSLTRFVDNIFMNYDKYSPCEVEFAKPENGGKLVMQPVLANESVKWEDVKEEAGILANAADFFEPVMYINKDIFSSIYLGVKDGFILSYDDQSDKKPLDITTYNFFDAEWYKLAEEKQEICFTDVYADLFGRGLVITCAGPIHDKNGEFCGVLGIDILINDLYSEVTDMKLGEDAKFFVAGSNGNIISIDPNINNRSAEELGISLMTADKDRMGSSTNGVIARGGRCFAFDSIETVGWMLCVNVPQERVKQLANDISRSIISSIIIFILFFFIILATVVILVLRNSKQITSPITGLMKDISEMSGGNLSHRAVAQGCTETSALADSFNEMADSLQKHIDKMTALTAEKERIGAELDIATKIQSDILPVDFPDRKDISLYATMTPAKEVGGDFYDFFFIDDDHLALVMADVSGKGIPAALFMVIAKSIIRNNAMMGGTAGSVLTASNRMLCKNNKTGFFVTAWIGILNISTGRLNFASAGHEYPAIMRENGTYKLYETDNLPPLAADEDIVYDEDSFTLDRSERLFLYTDGVTEAKSASGKRFGTERMIEVLDRNLESDACETINDMKKAIDDFAGNIDPFDDITMMSIIWNGQ